MRSLGGGRRGCGGGGCGGVGFLQLAYFGEGAYVGHPDDGGADLVGGGQVDLGGDAPVVVAGRVVEDLADHPALRLRLDDDHVGAAGVGAGADLVEVVEVRLQRVGPL